MRDLDGRIVLVTGAASGIGRQLAHAFAAEGSRVVVADINEESCRATAAELPGAIAYPLDVTDPGAARALVETVENEVGPLDVLVNCAGVVSMGEIVDVTMEEWRRIMGVNLWGPINLIHAFLPGMYERGRGHVVNISSGAGLFPLPGLGPYVTTKYALVGLSETLYMEARAHGVGVTVICPWGVHTPIVRGVRTFGLGENDSDRVIRFIKPFLKSPEHIADRVVRAVKKGTPVYMHTAFGKYMDAGHRLSRRAHLEGVSLLYRLARRFV